VIRRSYTYVFHAIYASYDRLQVRKQGAVRRRRRTGIGGVRERKGDILAFVALGSGASCIYLLTNRHAVHIHIVKDPPCGAFGIAPSLLLPRQILSPEKHLEPLLILLGWHLTARNITNTTFKEKSVSYTFFVHPPNRHSIDPLSFHISPFISLPPMFLSRLPRCYSFSVVYHLLYRSARPINHSSTPFGGEGNSKLF
jgi:hypothetical protein